MNIYNPFQMSSPIPTINPYMQQPNMLPQQEIIKVNGKASVDSIQLAPNSSLLCMDISAPVVWMCVSDGLGKVSVTGYEIRKLEEKPVEDIIEKRLSDIEMKITSMEERLNDKSDDVRTKQKQNYANNSADKRNG